MLTIVFLGTPDFSVPCLEYCHQSEQLTVLAVVSQPDRPSGRGQKLQPTPVKISAEAAGYTVYQPTKIRSDEALLETLRALEPDFLVTIAFGQILNEDVLAIPKYGTVNVHASLLPKYRGANPIQASIVSGESETGLTTMITELGVDTGPMLYTHTEAIGPKDTSEELFVRLSQAAGPLIERTLVDLASGTLKPQPQNDADATHAPKAKKEDAWLDWSRSARELDWQIRGQQPWPGASTHVGDDLLKIRRSCLSSSDVAVFGKPVGSVLGVQEDGVLVQCGEGVLVLLEVQPAGKATMPACSWWNGVQAKLGKGTDLVLETKQPSPVAG